jgi:N-acylneuraminate cytidylyltransferase
LIGGKHVVAAIPARGGSKKIPQKNLRELAGQPLLAWSIRVAKEVSEIDRTVVSTDDDEIARVGAIYGAEVIRRSPHLATDDALVIDALREMRDRMSEEPYGIDVMLLLEPTCPLRSPEDVRNCLHLLVETGLDSVATFQEALLNPHRAWRIEGGVPSVFVPGAVPWLPRQKQPEAYQLNGAVYAFVSSVLDEGSPGLLTGKMGAVIMPKSRSIDIDDETDLELAELIVKRGMHE